MTISLAKNQAQPLDLTKKSDAPASPLTVNLNWVRPRKLGVRLKIDGDLGVLYELTNGDKNAIQPLGSLFGSQNNKPGIWLDGDDRSGDNANGETVRFNPAFADQWQRALIYAYLYEGNDKSWHGLEGVVTITLPNGEQLSYKLDPPAKESGETKGAKSCCAIAEITWQNDELVVTPIDQYYRSQRYMNEAGHGPLLSWSVGSK